MRKKGCFKRLRKTDLDCDELFLPFREENLPFIDDNSILLQMFAEPLKTQAHLFNKLGIKNITLWLLGIRNVTSHK